MDTSPKHRVWGQTLAGVLLLFAGLACLAFVAVNLAQDVVLWAFGQRTQAEVVELWAEEVSGGEAGELVFRYFMRYRFTTPDGQVIVKDTGVAANEWLGLGQGRTSGGCAHVGGGEVQPAAGVYHEQATVPEFSIGGAERGSTVGVVYFPPYPAHNRLDESRFILILACSYVPLIAIGLVGWVGGRRLVRSARFLNERSTANATKSKLLGKELT